MKRSLGGERDDVNGVSISIDDDRGGSGVVRWELILYRQGGRRPMLNIVREGKAMSLSNAVMAAATKATFWLNRKGS